MRPVFGMWIPPAASQPLDLLLWPVLAVLIGILPVGHTMALRNVLLVVLLAGMAWRLVKQQRHPDLPLLRPWLAYGAIALLSLSFAVDSVYSQGEIRAEILQPLLLFCLVANLIRDITSLRCFALLLVCGNAFLVAFSLATTMIGGTTKDGLVGSLNSGVGNWSTYLVSVLPFLVVLAIDWQQRFGLRYGAIAVALVLAGVASLYFTLNRQSFIALFVELGVASVILVRTPVARRHWRWLLVPAMVFMVLFVTLYLQREPVAAVDFGRALQRDSRWEAWRLCLNQLAAHPWSGGGFGHRTFQFLYPELAARSPFWHAHNMILNKGVQMGLPGIMVFLLLYLAVPWQMAKGLRLGSGVGLYAAAGIVMTAGVFAKNMTDDFFYRESGYLFWLLAGAVIGAVRGATQERDFAQC